MLQRASDEFVANYVGVDYKTGDEFYDTWTDQSGPSRFHLGEVHKGWKEGLRGMRAGGLRELIAPSKLAYETGPLVYVIDLLAVN